MPPMRVAEFMSILHDRTAELLPADLRETGVPRIRFVWFQMHFHSPKVHYEVCLTRKTERIEIGLHFEGSHDFSYHWAGLMAEHMIDIQAQLGPEWELEEWTASWCRLHHTIPYNPLSQGLAYEVAEQFARLITVCQPIIERERVNVPAALEAAEPARKIVRSRFGRRTAKRAV